MSASEKLKALGGEVRSDEPFEVLRTELATDALVAALPQIVAVVEAAEGFFPEHLEILQGDLPSALAALEEALK